MCAERDFTEEVVFLTIPSTRRAPGGLFADGLHPVIDDRVGPSYQQMATCWFLDDGSAEWWGWQDRVNRITALP